VEASGCKADGAQAQGVSMFQAIIIIVIIGIHAVAILSDYIQGRTL
jgi:hypothetical protein